MQFTFHLSPQQSSRVIQQAVRHRAEVVLEPRGWALDDTLETTLHACDAEVLVVEASDRSEHPLEDLPGMHVDAQIVLGLTRYLCDTHVVDLDRPTGRRAQIVLARPRVLRVTQRRRFRRMMLRPSCRVRLQPIEAPTAEPVAGELLNLSVDGLACRVEQGAAQKVRIGDKMHVAFCPSEAERGFAFGGILRNKTYGASIGHVILGVEFLPEDQDEQARSNRERLREMLYGGPQEPALQEHLV